MSEIDLTDLLGRKLDDPEVQRAFSALEEEPNIERDETGTYYSFPAAGLSFFLRGGELLDSAFAFTEGDDEFDPYVGPLPRDLSISDTEADVRRKLGEPSQSGEGEFLPFMGKQQPPWIRYDFPEYSVHVEFAPDGSRILQVTLMDPSALTE